MRIEEFLEDDIIEIEDRLGEGVIDVHEDIPGASIYGWVKFHGVNQGFLTKNELVAYVSGVVDGLRASER